MTDNLFLILGNQLFETKILKESGCTRVFMAEDFGLCTYEKHHKLKLYLFLIISGISGIFIETHEDPDNAPSDGPNMLNIADLKKLLQKLKQIDNIIK